MTYEELFDSMLSCIYSYGKSIIYLDYDDTYREDFFEVLGKELAHYQCWLDKITKEANMAQSKKTKKSTKKQGK